MAVFPSFIFDTSKGESPQSIAQKRALAAQIMGGFGNRAARNVGEGVGNAFASLGQGITANVMNRRAAAGEEAGQTAAGDLRQQLINSMMGQSSFPAAPNPGNTSSMASMPAPDYASARVAQAHNAGSPLPKSFLSAVDSTEGAGGYDTLFGHAQRGPFAGTDVSQMTIGDALAFASPSGAYGQHVKGQIGRVATPMGRHQIVGTTLRNAVQEMGLDPSMPFDQNTQDAVAAHLARRRIAGAGTMDGKIAGLRSEWEGFKNVPRAQMEQIVRDLEAAPSAQPNAGGLTPEQLQAWGANTYAPMQDTGALGAVNALGAAQPVPVAENEADILAQEQAMAAQDPMAFQQPAPPMSAPQMNVPVNEIPSLMSGSQMQAQAGGFPEMAGRDPSRQPPPDLGMLMQVLSNPFMDEGTKAYAQAVLQQHMQAQDPMRQLQMERAQLENNALRNPQPDLTTGQREYQMAVQQGYQGSFMDYKRDLAEAQRAQTNITVGGDGAPGLGKLSADYGYVLDPTTRQPVIDPSTGLPQAAPVPGSPAARELEEAQRMSQERAGQGQRYGRIVGEDIGRVLDAVERNPNLVAGPIGSMLAQLPGTGAHDVASMLGTIRANIGFDRLQAMRAASPTGGALGAVSDSENRMLQATLGALEQSQSPQQFATNLRRLQNIYTEIVHGPAPDGVNDDEWTKRAWGAEGVSRRREINGYVIEQVD